MLRLSEGITATVEAGRTLVVPSKQRAAAVRLAHAAARAAAGDRAWRTPDVLGWSAWTERVWARSAGDDTPQLRAADEWLLWREVAAEASRDIPLLFTDSLAESLRRAATLVATWRLPHRLLGGSAGSEPALFASALGALERRCRDLGVVASHETIERMDEGARATFAGFAPLAAIHQAHADAMSVAELHGREDARARVAAAQDEEHETALIADWCRRRLAEDGGARLLIVVPGLEGRRARLLRAISATVSPQSILSLRSDDVLPCAVEGGEPLPSHPLVRHALETLTLCAGPLEFERVSSWLRSPWWKAPDVATRARLDLHLRRRGATQMDAETVARVLPPASDDDAGASTLRQLIQAALQALGRSAGGTRAWAERFTAALQAIGFPGARTLTSAEQQVWVRFVEALREFGEIAHARDSLGTARAVALLRDFVDRIAFEPASGDVAITVTDSPLDPVVHYDGIWIAGLQADAWPPPARPDPFVPLALQRQAGIPAASPGGQLANARELMRRMVARTPAFVASWPQRSGDAHLLASPLLAELPGRHDYPIADRHVSLPARLRAGAVRESYVDHRGTPRECVGVLPGGTRTLELQNECPFHAFAELRLGAEAIDQPSQGVDGRVRGKLLHRALEKVWLRLRGSSGLAAVDDVALRKLIERAVGEAAREFLTGREDEVAKRVARREERRANRLVRQLCELERERPEFTVEAVEFTREIELAGARIDLRIDRIDRLADGSKAILDYKTGRAKAHDWFGERLSNPQLVAYLLAVDGEVTALATAHVAKEGVAFKGITKGDAVLPKVKSLRSIAGTDTDSARDDDWHAARDRWIALTTQLMADHLAGHAPADPRKYACDHCHLESLCRIGDREAQGADEDEAGDAHE